MVVVSSCIVSSENLGRRKSYVINACRDNYLSFNLALLIILFKIRRLPKTEWKIFGIITGFIVMDWHKGEKNNWWETSELWKDKKYKLLCIYTLTATVFFFFLFFKLGSHIALCMEGRLFWLWCSFHIIISLVLKKKKKPNPPVWLGRRPHTLYLLDVICSPHFPSPSHFISV